MIFMRHRFTLYVAFSIAPITDKDSDIYFPTLPNVNANFASCLDAKHSMKYKTDAMIADFWSNTFTHSLNWPGANRLMQVFGTFPKWAKLNLEEVNQKLQECGQRSEFWTMMPKVKYGLFTTLQVGNSNTAPDG
jgi:hypothetical protein